MGKGGKAGKYQYSILRLRLVFYKKKMFLENKTRALQPFNI